MTQPIIFHTVGRLLMFSEFTREGRNSHRNDRCPAPGYWVGNRRVIIMGLLCVIRRQHFREGIPIQEVERRTGLSRKRSASQRWSGKSGQVR